jgi:hypothetical protein
MRGDQLIAAAPAARYRRSRRASAEALNLKPGTAVTAIIKSTDVMLATE